MAFVFLAAVAGCSDRPASDDSSAPVMPAEAVSIDVRASQAPISVNPLADTEWQLVEFQSMDDAAGTQRPDDPAKYTLRLNADGTAVINLNCNSLQTTWRTEPGAGGQSGQFSFGPLAGTQALCPPSGIDGQIEAQAPFISGYLLKDGLLNLSLMADGGIYVWKPS